MVARRSPSTSYTTPVDATFIVASTGVVYDGVQASGCGAHTRIAVSIRSQEWPAMAATVPVWRVAGWLRWTGLPVMRLTSINSKQPLVAWHLPP
jgi:hypothetical protein